MTAPPGTPSTGKGPFLSLLFTVLGLLAAAHPAWGRVVFLSQHSDQFIELAGYITAALGQLGLTNSHPPSWLRGPWDDFKHWCAVTFERRVP